MKFTVENEIPLPTRDMVIVRQCQRGDILSYSNLIVRKFKSNCGNLLEVHITRKSGYIKSIVPQYSCPPGCPSCADRIEKIRALIAMENATT